MASATMTMPKTPPTTIPAIWPSSSASLSEDPEPGATVDDAVMLVEIRDEVEVEVGATVGHVNPSGSSVNQVVMPLAGLAKLKILLLIVKTEVLVSCEIEASEVWTGVEIVVRTEAVVEVVGSGVIVDTSWVLAIEVGVKDPAVTNKVVVEVGVAVTDTMMGFTTVAVETKLPVLVRVTVVSMVTIEIIPMTVTGASKTWRRTPRRAVTSVVGVGGGVESRREESDVESGRGALSRGRPAFADEIESSWYLAAGEANSRLAKLLGACAIATVLVSVTKIGSTTVTVSASVETTTCVSLGTSTKDVLVSVAVESDSDSWLEGLRKMVSDSTLAAIGEGLRTSNSAWPRDASFLCHRAGSAIRPTPSSLLPISRQSGDDARSRCSPLATPAMSPHQSGAKKLMFREQERHREPEKRRLRQKSSNRQARSEFAAW